MTPQPQIPNPSRDEFETQKQINNASSLWTIMLMNQIQFQGEVATSALLPTIGNEYDAYVTIDKRYTWIRCGWQWVRLDQFMISQLGLSGGNTVVQTFADYNAMVAWADPSKDWIFIVTDVNGQDPSNPSVTWPAKYIFDQAVPVFSLIKPTPSTQAEAGQGTISDKYLSPTTANPNNYSPVVGTIDPSLDVFKLYSSDDSAVRKITINDAINAASLPAITKTHQEMVDMEDNNEFSVWQKYTITDFETIFKDPVTDTIFTWPTEPLTVVAIDAGELSPYASSESNPNDLISYQLDPAPILSPYQVYEEWEWSTVTSSFLEGVVSFNFTTTGFNIVLDNPLDLDQFWNFTFENFSNWNYWEFNDTMTNLIGNWDISVTNNWGNDYDIAILSVDQNNLASFDFSLVVSNVDQYVSEQQSQTLLWTTKGRITRREDPIQSNVVSIWSATLDYETADFRWSSLNRALLDPGSAGYSLWPVYWSIELSDISESSSWSWWSVTKTITVDWNDIQSVPMFNNYGNVENFRSSIWVVALNATFAQDVYWYQFDWFSWGLHYEGEVQNVTIWSNCFHAWVYLQGAEDIIVKNDASLVYSFCVSWMSKHTVIWWDIDWGLTNENWSFTWFNIINASIWGFNFENTNIENLNFYDGFIDGIRIDTPTWNCENNYFYLRGSGMDDCYFNVTDNMEWNYFWIWNLWDTNTGWNVTGEFKKNYLEVTDWFRNSDFTWWFVAVKWHAKSIWNNTVSSDFEFVTMYWIVFDWNDLSWPQFRIINIFWTFEGNTVTQNISQTNFMQRVADSDLDIEFSNTNVMPEIDWVSWNTTPIIYEDVVWKSPDWVYWKRTFVNTTWALSTSAIS